MIEQELRNKYIDCLEALDIYENKDSLKLTRIIIKKECRDVGIGSKLMTDLINYADSNYKIITLTPSSDFGGNKNRLIQFYKRFNFKHNKGIYKNFQYMDAMIRYPKKINESMTKTTIKRLLREGLLTKDEQDIRKISDFINFAKDYLGITDDVKVELAFERTPDITTTAYYDLSGLVKVYVKDRSSMDVCRSICHELVHHLQNIEGRLNNPMEDGADGSPIENEANAKAGEILRKWGKLHPELYI